jgi:hypothetical protein
MYLAEAYCMLGKFKESLSYLELAESQSQNYFDSQTQSVGGDTILPKN